MSDTREFSVGSARQASADGRLGEWVQEFLSSPGSDNAELAAAFAFRGAVFLGPVELPLDLLTPMAGPDEDQVVVPIPETEWESDIESMESEVEHGWDPPPLLVTYRDGGYFVEDGNHRFEALKRNGDTRGWAVLAFASVSERDTFLSGDGRVGR
jgi:hypothetical protein